MPLGAVKVGLFAAAGAGGVNLTGSAGYFMGGYGTGASTSIEQLTFPADVGTALTLTLSAASRNGYGFGNDGVAGYTTLGQSGSNVATVDKLVYSTGTISSLSAGISTASRGHSAASNVGTAGYVTFGETGATYYGTVDKFAYSNDSRSTLSSGLSSARAYTAGMSNSGTAAYFGAGYFWNQTYTFYTTVAKFAYSNDSRSTLSSGVLSDQVFSPAAMANSGTAGYFCGGSPSVTSNNDKVTKFAFSNDSRSTLTTGLSGNSRYGAAMADSGVAGYVALSNSYSGGDTAVMDKFAFSNDSRTSLTTVVTRAYRPSAFSNCANLAP